MIMSKGSLSIFWTNSVLVATIMVLSMILLFWPLLSAALKRTFRNS